MLSPSWLKYIANAPSDSIFYSRPGAHGARRKPYNFMATFNIVASPARLVLTFKYRYGPTPYVI